MDWLDALVQCKQDNVACVVVLITDVQGSAPRSVGTRMVVTADKIYGTIGGGALELEGISHARALMDIACVCKQNKCVSSRLFNLAPELSQCCGGKVTLQFDCHLANDFVVHVFGAGHVAQELAKLLTRLPCVATFHDTRSDWLSQVETCAQQDSPVSSSQIKTRLLGDNVFAHVESLEPGAYYIIMTHSHEIDMDVVEAVLSRADAAYCGLIASKSKAAAFRKRLRRKGFTEQELLQLTAPIGQTIKTGNTPMEVAIAAASDVLNVKNRLLVTSSITV